MKYFDIIYEKEISKKYSITEEDTNNLLILCQKIILIF